MKNSRKYNACFNCTERHIGCHSECEKYKEYRKIRDEELKDEHMKTQTKVKTLEEISYLRKCMKRKK